MMHVGGGGGGGGGDHAGLSIREVGKIYRSCTVYTALHQHSTSELYVSVRVRPCKCKCKCKCARMYVRQKCPASFLCGYAQTLAVQTFVCQLCGG